MKKSIIFFLLILSGSALAAPQDLNVPLGGGLIQPNGALKIMLNPLNPTVAYTVTCGINAANTTAIHFTMQGAYSLDGFRATLNGSLLGRFGQYDGSTGYNGFQLAIEGNSYNSEPYISSDAYIDLLNLDNSITETVSCSATPILTGNKQNRR
jgi:hypothetical protein